MDTLFGPSFRAGVGAWGAPFGWVGLARLPIRAPTGYGHAGKGKGTANASTSFRLIGGPEKGRLLPYFH